MNEKEVLEILGKVGAVLVDGHFVYKSGMHGSKYVNKDAVYPHLEESDKLAEAMAEIFIGDEVEVVVGPAVGGALFARDVARRLVQITSRKIMPVFADKDGLNFVIKREYDKIVAGKRVLVVEDVLTTGTSAGLSVEAVRTVGGIVVGLGAICNRGGVKSEDVGNPTKFSSLINVSFETYRSEDCPFCKTGVPINTDVGKGREFLAKKNSS
jgi:orotate phosphoribosyltransferase